MVVRNLSCVINLTNSIIGVGILAMPFCIQQCGLVLGLLMLATSTWFTYTSCCLLMKAGVTSQRKSYAYLAYFTYGAAGKLLVEIGMIGLQLGTCIAFNVVIGDLGPSIVSRQLGIENGGNLRTLMMIVMIVCVAFPLSLRRHLNSLSSISSLSLGFYAIFVCFVFVTALPKLYSGEWVKQVRLWRPAGIFQCLPIFSLAFACQAQLFIIYDALPEPSLASIKGVVRNAIQTCSFAYTCVGFLGYVAFADTNISGDILTSFKPGFFTNLIQLGFVVSIALSFPLILFPCRLSIYTLCFPQKSRSHDSIEDAGIPELHFNVITTLVMMGTLTVGILIPNVEFILALCGATTGCLVSFIMPPILFIKVMSSSAENKIKARCILFLGIVILFMSTYTTIANQSAHHHADIHPIAEKDMANGPNVVPVDKIKVHNDGVDQKVAENGKPVENQIGRREPVNPAEPNVAVIDVNKKQAVLKNPGIVKGPTGAAPIGEKTEKVAVGKPLLNRDRVKQVQV